MFKLGDQVRDTVGRRTGTVVDIANGTLVVRLNSGKGLIVGREAWFELESDSADRADEYYSRKLGY